MVEKLIENRLVTQAGKMLQITLQGVLFLLLPIIVFTFLTSKTEFIKGYTSYVVLTGSMEPTVPVGSVIYAKRQLGYNAGDIVAFKNSSDDTVTHRIADLLYGQSTSYVTKGDANNAVDRDAVPAGKVIGRVYFTIPYAGYFINYLRTINGFMFLVIFPVAIFIALELWNIKKEMERQIEKRMFEKYQNQQFSLQQ